ncbi:Na+/H+ antiporter subunit D [Subtercola boreus]|uniref:Na+/H+ antiporter subunit D n=1 Tax=Subtercola boreus TaxID=120213 RepID=A0A3E0WDY0_9MICO|nr:Na+/H+ antiporter subunit D [Subtercola boreus]RFA21129.1 Na+/H+ antiporter subunit D [Subtercola boreus]RFA21512.1 Na+/H+ antiporter subunit D [Subtercola boreus]RFA27482.1 Na+/H+ antiporter subunit D [Subtercola boreus]
MNVLVPLLVVLPLVGAAITLILGRNPRLQVTISISTLSVVTGIAGILLFVVDTTGETAVVKVGGWEPPFGIVLVVDRLSAMMVVVSALILLGVLVFAIGQGIADGDRDTPVSIFHPTYLILSAGLFDAFIAGDLFNMYVGFEMLLAASYVLLTLGGTGARIRAGTTYIVVSLVSSLFFLAAIALIYGATGTVTMALLSTRIQALPLDVQIILCAALLIGFGVKAAVFPLSFWLPDSYPTAPAPVTAVFAGLLTKVGVYAIIRTDKLLFFAVPLAIPLMVVAFFTLVIGIFGALTQADVKRLLSFTLVSHIGYMIFGIAIGTQLGTGATIYYIVHHIMVQTALFVSVGLIERVGRSTSITHLGGLLKKAPFVAILFFIGALNLGGIPPFSGFLGKVALFEAGAESPNPLVYVLIGAGALTSLLTLYALMRVWNKAFWRPAADVKGYESPLLASVRESPDETGGVVTATLPKLMVAATTGLIALTVCLTVFAGPLFELSERAAVGVATPAEYIDAVFPGGAP